MKLPHGHILPYWLSVHTGQVVGCVAACGAVEASAQGGGIAVLLQDTLHLQYLVGDRQGCAPANASVTCRVRLGSGSVFRGSAVGRIRCCAVLPDR